MKRLIFPILVLLVIGFTGTSEAQSSSSKQIGHPAPKTTRNRNEDQDRYVPPKTTKPEKEEPKPPKQDPLGAPTDLRFKIKYTDYLSGTVELKWKDNSSEETEFVLSEAIQAQFGPNSGDDCHNWQNHEPLHLPANTESYTWKIPDPNYRGGIGLLNAHSLILEYLKCPQEYILVARNATGQSLSNTIRLDADTPNAPYDVVYYIAHQEHITWKYEPKYPSDISTTNPNLTCFIADGIGQLCGGACYYCNGGFFSFHEPGSITYSAHLSPEIGLGYLRGPFPKCTSLQTQIRVGGPGPGTRVIPLSKPSNVACEPYDPVYNPNPYTPSPKVEGQ